MYKKETKVYIFVIPNSNNGNSMKNTLSIVVLFLISLQSILGQTVKFDELENAKPGSVTIYEGSDGGVYKIGDHIKLGMPSSEKSFAFILEGDGILTPKTNVSVEFSGQETEIKRMWIEGNKVSGYSLKMKTINPNGIYNYDVQFENALKTGEIVGLGMSSDEALSKLKKAKDKLDLGLITQSEYEKVKAELAKYIK